MPITGNYINANERQNDQTGSAASVFTDILQNSLKRKQELEFEAQKADAEFKRNLHYKDLLNAANEAKSGSYNDNSELGRATRNVNNPTYAGTKVIKSPVTPPNAMMSLVSGAYGDAAGNPIAAMANGIGNENASAFQQLTNTAKEVIPQIQQDPRYTMEFDNGKFGIKDNQKEQDSFLEKAATAGVDPYENGRPKTRTQILSEMAKQKNYFSSIDGSMLTDEQKLQGMALAKKIYGVRGIQNGLPAIYKELSSGKSINNIEDSLRYSGQSKDMTGDFRNAAQSVLINAPVATSQKAMDYIDDYISNGDVEGAKQQLKRLARKEAGVEESRVIGGKERTVEFLGEIQDDLNALEKNGVNTNIFSGTAEEISRRIGLVREPELRRVATKIALAIQNYRRSMSGAAFSIPESKEYSAVFPSIDKVSNFNTAQISALRDTFSGDLDSFYSLSMGKNEYNKLFGKSNNSGNNGGQESTDPEYEKYLQAVGAK